MHQPTSITYTIGSIAEHYSAHHGRDESACGPDHLESGSRQVMLVVEGGGVVMEVGVVMVVVVLVLVLVVWWWRRVEMSWCW